MPGFTDLLGRFNISDSNLKSQILLSQSSLNINRSPTLPNAFLHVPDLSTNLSLPSQAMCRAMRMIPIRTSHQRMADGSVVI